MQIEKLADDDTVFLHQIAAWFRKSEYRYLEVNDDQAFAIAVRLQKIGDAHQAPAQSSSVRQA